MRLSHALLLPSIVALSGCLNPPAENRQSQTRSLEDSIRFAEMTVVGRSTLLRVNRADVGEVRANSPDANDFTDQIALVKNAVGDFSPNSGLTRTTLAFSPFCTAEKPCTSTRMALVLGRDGPTVADAVTLIFRRIPNVTCTTSFVSENGTVTVSNPTFSNVTITTSELNGAASGRYSFYAKQTWQVTALKQVTVFFRNFLGRPSELWIDQFEPEAKRETLTSENLNWSESTKRIELLAIRDGRQASLECTY